MRIDANHGMITRVFEHATTGFKVPTCDEQHLTLHHAVGKRVHNANSIVASEDFHVLFVYVHCP